MTDLLLDLSVYTALLKEEPVEITYPLARSLLMNACKSENSCF